jgi:hypothetical protein
MEQLPASLHLRVGPVLHLVPDGRRGIDIRFPLGDDPLEVQPFRRAEEVPAAAFDRKQAREDRARGPDEALEGTRRR